MIKRFVKLYNNIPGIIMLVMVMLPFFANMFFSNTELLDNRNLYTKPTKLTRNFSKDYEAYYNDTFAYRSKLVKRYVKLQNKLHLDTGKFFYGLNDWMFFDSAKLQDGDSLADYKGAIRYSQEDKDKVLKGYLKVEKFFRDRGVSYLVIVAPNKENIYSEFMPINWHSARVSDVSRIDDVINYVNQNNGRTLDILNLKPMLLDAKGKYPFDLYYMTDTHWNRMGAFLGYQEILKELNKMGLKVPLTKLTPKMVVELGKRTFDMNNTYKEMAYDVEYYPNIKPVLVAEEHEGKRLIYHTENALTNKKLLIIRDSFAADLLPLLTKVFKDVVSVQQSRGTHESMEEFIKQYKPDIVIDEAVERKFPKFLRYLEYYENY